ncbi:trehalose-phosphatase [Geobacter anodireducens]
MLATDTLKRLWIFSFDRTLTAAGACYAKARLHRVTRQFLEELAALPGHRVAVLSSRPLDDLVSRVPIEGIYLGGSCGTEWHIPGGESMTLSGKPKDMLMETRDALLPALRAVADLPGVELEDRRWSAALHTQEASTKRARRSLPDSPPCSRGGGWPFTGIPPWWRSSSFPRSPWSSAPARCAGSWDTAEKWSVPAVTRTTPRPCAGPSTRGELRSASAGTRSCRGRDR